MAKAKTRARKSATKSKSKKSTKKTVKLSAKKSAKKAAKRVGAKKATTEPRVKKERPSIKTIYENIKLLRVELGKLGHWVQNMDFSVNKKLSKMGQNENTTQTEPNDQMELFSPDLKSNGKGSGRGNVSGNTKENTDITKEDVTQAFQDVLAKSGSAQVKEILGMHDAKKISDLEPKQWASCYQMCKDNTL